MTGLVPTAVSVDGQPVGVAPAAVAAPPVVTPTQQVVIDANAVVYGTDSRGRRIGVMRPSGSVRRRVLRLLNVDAASKQQLVQEYIVAACVTEIAGEQVAFPTSEFILEALCERLDDHGMAEALKLVVRFSSNRGTDLKN